MEYRHRLRALDGLSWHRAMPSLFPMEEDAKSELRNLFRELLTRLQTIEFGEPDLLYSSFVHGIKRLPAHVR